MVEGPGATRNGRKVQLAVGLTVKELESLVRKDELAGKLLDRRLEEAFTVGKEVFLIFRSLEDGQISVGSLPDDIALRLHFGMNGSLYLRNLRDKNSKGAVPSWRQRQASSLTIQFQSYNNEQCMILETKDAKASLVSAVVARSKRNRLEMRDVCSDNFDPDAVINAVTEKRATAIISDAILDQERFPGVGNIIKIEGLHRSKVHPRRQVSSLSKDELGAIVSNCRAYAMKWLSSGKAPTKAVYNQTQCKTCNEYNVKMVKLGKDLSRVTFWCIGCQPISASTERTTIKISQSVTSNSVSCPTLTKPCCPQHGSSSLLLRRVRKDNSSNRNRLFRLCKARSCEYFSWADSHLPSCSCGKKAILRISKTERTGGRWFISCRTTTSKPTAQQRGCRFFSWAEPSHLKPFGTSLTPLL